MNLLNNTPNQPSKFLPKNWFEVNVDAPRTYNRNSQMKFNTSTLIQVYVIIVMHIYLSVEL